ncbi:PREDICTED: fatty acyl-CoA reductase 3-like [Fragaria vesca subsp. vesca]|uniref:fatty acyl-CoA reductase 3-like n=1 Tax=Fragaria vesca subsp. vesca TaxID=101020 RepID=UPI0002C2FDE2|nr:PREDICTED: fatty acyl-CoA reductase 3-like [Fragaria vesca subsp. vesca]
MELQSILGYLCNKTILITGATGLLGMVFVEKILRVQPDVKKLYLLVRPSHDKSATQRVNEEIIGKELFKILKEKWGTDFDYFVSQKVVALSGDVSSENLGLNKVILEQVCSETQIIINSAANTNFDERYDISLGINTFGVSHMLNVTNKCSKLEMFLHVSTVYVCGERTGIILEDFSSMEEMVNDSTKFDFEVLESNLVKEKLNELRTQNAVEEVITNTMKNFGIERAKFYGWPNTYVFTKAMGELLLKHYSNKNIPFVIIRPPIITSTYMEPFPGWIQGYRTVDSVIASYAKGKLTFLPLDPMTISDMMPVDIVVNSIIAAMVVNAKKTSGTIYHVGSSLRNSIKFMDVRNFMFQYFTKYPWVYKDGKPIKVRLLTIFKTMATFLIYMKICYMLPLKGLEVVNKLSYEYFQDVYDKNHQKLGLVMRMAELYRPYLLFKGIFDDTNTEKLRMLTKECFVDAESFKFDPTCIDWEDYFMHTHIPGFLKHVMMK